jgi:uncharacterized protein involved in outer membrane biogenesis
MTSKIRKWIIVPGVVVLCLLTVVLILSKLSGQFLKTKVEKALGENVKAGAVSIYWGKVIVEDLTFLRDGQTVGKVKAINIRADFMSIIGDKLVISKVEVDQPYFRLVIDNKGNLLLPIALPEEKTGEDKQKGKRKEIRKDQKPKDTMPVEVKTLVVRDGKVDFEDRSAARPVLLKFEDVKIDVNRIAYPFTNQWTEYEVSSQLTGGSQKGSINAIGKTNPMNEEAKVKTTMKNIDLALLRPYIEKKGDAGIERGFINMNMDAGIVKKHIKAPGTMAIRDLQLSSSGGISGTFLGVPRSMVLTFLKNNNNEISLNFVLEGDLSNPKFNIRENLATRLSVGLANKLGVSINGAGRAVAGGSSKTIGETMKTLKGLFK